MLSGVTVEKTSFIKSNVLKGKMIFNFKDTVVLSRRFFFGYTMKQWRIV